MNKIFLPYDVYERHRRISEFVKASDKVLDVGGELNHLSQFVKTQKLVVANLNTGDVIINKSDLPFAKNSFDVVCAIDVLEHIPKNDRRKFVANLVKITKDKVIMSFPLGTTSHIIYENKIQKYLLKKRVDVAYLKEHIKYGLPKMEEINKLSEIYNIKIYFSGSIIINEHLFKFLLFDPKIKIIRKIIYLSKLFINLVTNPIFYQLLSKKTYSKNINRVYLIIFK